MTRLDILVHRGCMSEQSVGALAQEIQHELPNWQIDVRAAEKQDTDSLGILAFPAFLIDGQVLAIGIPRKDWLLARLREWERGKQ
jgi:thioredoxin